MKQSVLNELHRQQETLKSAGVRFRTMAMFDRLSEAVKAALNMIPPEIISQGAADVKYYVEACHMAIEEDVKKSY